MGKGKKKIFFLQGFPTWTKNKLDMTQINRRKKAKQTSFIRCTRRPNNEIEDPNK